MGNVNGVWADYGHLLEANESCAKWLWLRDDGLCESGNM